MTNNNTRYHIKYGICLENFHLLVGGLFGDEASKSELLNNEDEPVEQFSFFALEEAKYKQIFLVKILLYVSK